MPLLSSKLPQYNGEYSVGLIDLEVECEKRRFGEVVYKKSREPALQLETVLFSLYYPTDARSSPVPRHPWVPKPLAFTAQGYARCAKIDNFVTNKLFTGALWALVGGTRIPALVDVPLRGTAKKSSNHAPGEEHDESERFPVIVFSHGVVSSRTSYTQYCGELASRGFIVAAIEHRDGSGPGTVVMNKTSAKPLLYQHADNLDPVLEPLEFKKVQLAMREAEVEETVRVLQMINEGKGADIFKNNPRFEGQDLADFKGRLMMDRMVIAGHSFGATLTLQTLKGGPSAKLPFVGAVALDPGKQSGPLNDDIHVPIVVVNSQSWSAKHTVFMGSPHFCVIKDLVAKVIKEKKKAAWFTTAKGTTHPSVTDAPLIEPMLLAWTTGATIDAREGVMQYVKISQEFMNFLRDGRRQSILEQGITHHAYDAEPTEESGNPVSNYWQIHLTPPMADHAASDSGPEDSDGTDEDKKYS